jgi:hypothetical protein
MVRSAHGAHLAGMGRGAPCRNEEVCFDARVPVHRGIGAPRERHAPYGPRVEGGP